MLFTVIGLGGASLRAKEMTAEPQREEGVVLQQLEDILNSIPDDQLPPVTSDTTKLTRYYAQVNLASMAIYCCVASC